MNRDETLKLLRAHKATLAQRFGVVDLALFGSIVRSRAIGNSDVDVLVRVRLAGDVKAVFWCAVLHRRPARASGRSGN